MLWVCPLCVCSIDAVYKVQDLLHMKRPADALVFLRAARWVFRYCIGYMTVCEGLCAARWVVRYGIGYMTVCEVLCSSL